MSDPRFYPPRNFGWLEPYYADPATATTVLLPVPYDSTTTAHPGARFGPQAMVDASADMELFDLEVEDEPYRRGIATLPEVAPHLGSPEAMVLRVRDLVGEWLDRGKLVGVLGGEHSIAIGPVLAHLARQEGASAGPRLSVLYLDAHADFRASYLDTPYNHACALRRMVEAGARPVHVGLRSAEREEYTELRALGVPAFPAARFPRPAQAADEICAALGPDVYVSVDLDVIDSAALPAVGTPEPGGLSWRDVASLLEAVAARRRIVGFDVVELAPELGPPAAAQAAAKLAYRIIGLATRGRPYLPEPEAAP